MKNSLDLYHKVEYQILIQLKLIYKSERTHSFAPTIKSITKKNSTRHIDHKPSNKNSKSQIFLKNILKQSISS